MSSWEEQLQKLLGTAEEAAAATGAKGCEDSAESKERFVRAAAAFVELLTEAKFVRYLRCGAEPPAAPTAMTMTGGAPATEEEVMALAAEEAKLAREIAKTHEQIKLEKAMAEVTEREISSLRQRLAEATHQRFQSREQQTTATSEAGASDTERAEMTKAARVVLEGILGVVVRSISQDGGQFVLEVCHGKFVVAVRHAPSGTIESLSISPEVATATAVPVRTVADLPVLIQHLSRC
jgi:hypothetical protein